MESLKSFLYVSGNRNILTFQLKGLSFILGNGNHKELSIFHEVTFWSWKINKLTLKKFLIFLEMEHSSPKLKKFLSFLGKPLRFVRHCFFRSFHFSELTFSYCFGCFHFWLHFSYHQLYSFLSVISFLCWCPRVLQTLERSFFYSQAF